MIVKEKDNHFVLIRQTHHAMLSGLLAKAWKDVLFLGESFRQSVEYAAMHHDVGWARFDEAPFLNDRTRAPYSFDDFPDAPKTVLYKHGIDAVMENDLYAALLCSVHYANFYPDPEEEEVLQFVQAEEKRQALLRSRIEGFNESDFQAHYDLLKLVDALSLFVCLNEPGTPAEEGHPFFQKGIPVPDALQLEEKIVHPQWLDSETLALNVFPFEHPVEGSVPLKRLTKAALTENGLLAGYKEAFVEEMTIQFVPQEK
ncbi:DUF3891 family protein [Atopococcus tabaci]|uniref:DUF3891 family protein n=1 Tax=Atopococcus tabaci TaxID=269774 RepID=UPI0003F8799D|nr:DUF3891 family protein [Atopococcus tabaci]